MATAVQVESIWNGLTDNNGQPLAAGKVYTYSAGTTTPVSLFTASDKSTSATNPLILDAYGKAQVWADGRYKFVVKTSADVTLYTLDNLLYGFDDTTILYGGTSTGAANAQVVSVPATVTSYANGQTISFVAGYTNTGATTIQFNSLSAISLVKGNTPSSLQAGDLIAGQLYTATYHGGSFRLQDYPSVADVQRSRFLLASSVAGTNTITANLSPAPSSYETGMVVTLVAANANTGASTLNLNSLGAKAIQRQGTALVGNEIKAGDVVQVFYDGTQFQLLNVAPAPLFVDRVNSRVGIGTTSPAANLHVSGITNMYANVNSAYAAVVRNDNTGGAAYGLIVDGARNNYAFAVRDYLGNYRVVLNSDGTCGIGAVGGNNASITVGSGGTVLLQTGNTSRFQVDSSTGYKQFYNGAIYIDSSAISSGAGTNALKYNTNSGFVTWDASSQLVKENIVDNPYGLDAVLALKPRKYFRTDDQKEEIGFVADELVHTIPEVVSFAKKSWFTKNEEDTELVPSSVAYDRLTSVLCKAIQELNAKVDALEARVAALEAV